MNTHAGYELYISSVPQRKNRVLSDFTAMEWVQIKGVGEHGETGTTTNILTYDTYDTDVALKAKGISNAGDPVVEVSRIPGDPGQLLMRDAGSGSFNWGFKIVGGGIARYNLGLVAGPVAPQGRNEDFAIERFTLALQQIELTDLAFPAGWVGLDSLAVGLDGLVIGLAA